MDCSRPGSSVHGTLQARVLEWIAIPFSKGSSQPEDQTQVSCSVGGAFYHVTTSSPAFKMNQFTYKENAKMQLGKLIPETTGTLQIP